MQVMEELSAQELADRSGVTTEQLRRLVELGIITSTSEGAFGTRTSSASVLSMPWPMPASPPSSSRK